jgi:UDP:flavonoid glycosyltransferase YjiC (YdhE family)
MKLLKHIQITSIAYTVQVVAFFEAFSRLPQRVVMRMIPPDDIKFPKNIMVKEFLPQQSILAHPNVKVRIGYR